MEDSGVKEQVGLCHHRLHPRMPESAPAHHADGVSGEQGAGGVAGNPEEV